MVIPFRSVVPIPVIIVGRLAPAWTDHVFHLGRWRV